MKKTDILSKPNLLLLGLFLSTTIFSQVLMNSADQKLAWDNCYDNGLHTARKLNDSMLSGKISITPIQTFQYDAMTVENDTEELSPLN